MLENRHPVRHQQTAQLRQDDPVRLQPVRAAGEGSLRLPLRYFGFKGGNLRFRDIGWIADDEIEASLQPLTPVAQAELRPLRKTRPNRILPRRPDGTDAGIDAQAPSLGQFRKQREKQATTAAAQIEQAQRCSTVLHFLEQARDRKSTRLNSS